MTLARGGTTDQFEIVIRVSLAVSGACWRSLTAIALEAYAKQCLSPAGFLSARVILIVLNAAGAIADERAPAADPPLHPQIEYSSTHRRDGPNAMALNPAERINGDQSSMDSLTGKPEGLIFVRAFSASSLPSGVHPRRRIVHLLSMRDCNRFL